MEPSREFADELFVGLQLWLHIANCAPPMFERSTRIKWFPWCRIIKMNLTMNFELTLEWFWINERDWTWIIMNQTEFFWIWANPGCFIFELTHLSSFFFDRHFENQYRLRNCESDLGGQGLTLNESQYEPRDSCERLHRNIIKMFINIIKIIDVILQLFPSWSLFRSTSPCDRFSSYRDGN